MFVPHLSVAQRVAQGAAAWAAGLAEVELLALKLGVAPCGWTNSTSQQMVLGVDSDSILFSHRSCFFLFQELAASPGFLVVY